MLELITGVVVAIVAIGAVLEPLMRRSPVAPSGVDALGDAADDLVDLEETESPKIRALLALREIEFDRATGKLSETDYASLKQQYARTALAAIEEERQTPAAPDESAMDDAEAVVSKVKARRLAQCPTCDRRLEPGSVFCSHCGRSLHSATAGPRCWICGTDLRADATFCGGCGAEVPGDAAVAERVS